MEVKKKKKKYKQIRNEIKRIFVHKIKLRENPAYVTQQFLNKISNIIILNVTYNTSWNNSVCVCMCFCAIISIIISRNLLVNVPRIYFTVSDNRFVYSITARITYTKRASSNFMFVSRERISIPKIIFRSKSLLILNSFIIEIFVLDELFSRKFSQLLLGIFKFGEIA